jgi:hypothetical protein
MGKVVVAVSRALLLRGGQRQERLRRRRRHQALLIALTLLAALAGRAEAILLEPASPPLLVEFNDLAPTAPPCVSTAFGASVSYVGLEDGTFKIEIFDGASGALVFETPQPINGVGGLNAGVSFGRTAPFPFGPTVMVRITVLAGSLDLDSARVHVGHCLQSMLFRRDTPDVIVILHGDRALNGGQDAYVSRGAPNTNEGGSEFLRVGMSGSKRILIDFFDANFMFIADQQRPVASALLRLKVLENGRNWGRDGRTLDLHRLIVPWQGGDGYNAGYRRADANRGTVPGVTWNCAIDDDSTNSRADCSGATAWEMGKPQRHELHPWVMEPTASAIVTNEVADHVDFDVTSDVHAFLTGAAPNYGWLIKKTHEGLPGRIEFASSETHLQPRLLIFYE